ncbi:MAG: hypothetical protein M3506_00320 [Chloroflexota bacterium]|nr:hypothetical protein [Chloroflexota bacterium]
MYVWITARKIRKGMMGDFLKVWQDPCIGLPVAPSSLDGPTVYALHPTDDPDEMWGIGFFDSRETIDRFRQSAAAGKRAEALAPFVEAVLWERQFEAQPWSESDRPLVYAVYFRQTPVQRYKLVCICPSAKDAIEQADALMRRAESSGFVEPEWTMRAFHHRDEALESLLPTEGHVHVGLTS